VSRIIGIGNEAVAKGAEISFLGKALFAGDLPRFADDREPVPYHASYPISSNLDDVAEFDNRLELDDCGGGRDGSFDPESLLCLHHFSGRRCPEGFSEQAKVFSSGQCFCGCHAAVSFFGVGMYAFWPISSVIRACMQDAHGPSCSLCPH
jgi:hypothetical protein